MPGINGSVVASDLQKLNDQKLFKVIMVSADYVYGIDELIEFTMLKPLELNLVKEE